MPSSDAFDELFDRERLVGGLPAKRATTLLFLIESRTARLVAESRRAVLPAFTQAGARERELEFLEAFALGREPPLRPTIQDLELHAPRWAQLVAQNASVQAALARQFSEKYRFARADVPAIRAALGLHDPTVEEAFERLYRRPLDSIFVGPPRGLERVRWARAALSARIDALSPFWTAYALTLTETVASAVVALPIALAAIGPLPAVAILVGMGLVTVLTVAFMADALTRTRTIRFGDAYIGRVVTRLLGRPGALVLTVGVVGYCAVGLQAHYIGISATLTDASGVPTIAWVVILFGVDLWYVRRGSIDATVTSALVVGAINLTLIVVLSALAAAHIDPSNLTRVELPGVGDHGFDTDALALVFGVTFMAYFGHLSVSNCARVVLRRDPSGGSLVRGVAAAQLTAIAFYVLFIVTILGAVAPDALSNARGTALGPLADEAGSVVLLLGGILVVLAMGMASIHAGLTLFYLVLERLPARASRAVVLPRRGAQLVLESAGRRITIGYAGLVRGVPQFRLDAAGERVEAEWDAFDEKLVGDTQISVIAASEHEVRFELTASMRVSYEGEWDTAGVDLAGVLELEDREAAALAAVMRNGSASIARVARAIEVDDATAAEALAGLADRGLVVVTGSREYAAVAGRRRGGRLTPEIWKALNPTGDQDVAAAAPRRSLAARFLATEQGRFAAGAAPLAAVFATAVWQALTGAVSFADVLSFLGVIIVALLAGIFPVLLLVAARRKGELPAWGYRLPAQPWLLAAVSAFALGGVALHGLVLWDDPFQRAAALAVVVLTLVMTASMVRNGAFARQATIELREECGNDIASLSILAAGRHLDADVGLEYAGGHRVALNGASRVARFSALRRMTVSADWPDAGAQVKVWVHRVTGDGDSEPLEARVGSADGAAVALDGEGEALVAPAATLAIVLSD